MSRPSITKRPALSDRSTCKCILIGTLGTIIALDWKRRSENATKLMIQVSKFTICLILDLFGSFQWHSLSKVEQAKYYDQARKERQIHMDRYPGWTARDNYAKHKKKKRRKEVIRDGNGGAGGGGGGVSNGDSAGGGTRSRCLSQPQKLDCVVVVVVVVLTI